MREARTARESSVQMWSVGEIIFVSCGERERGEREEREGKAEEVKMVALLGALAVLVVVAEMAPSTELFWAAWGEGEILRFGF